MVRFMFKSVILDNLNMFVSTWSAFNNILGKKYKKEHALSYNLSEISATEFEDYCKPCKTVKLQKYPKTHHRQKRKREEPIEAIKNKDHKKKTNHPKRKLDSIKIVSESSEESGDEYRTRRRRLADAVVVTKPNNDKTSLSERLQKMLCGVNPEPVKLPNLSQNDNDDSPPNCSPILSQNIDENILCTEIKNNTLDIKSSCEIIDICTDDDNKPEVVLKPVDTVNSVTKEDEQVNDVQKVVDRDKNLNNDSDDDLELLRQHALKTKTVKASKIGDNKLLSEEEDSDTTELRLICLKSALLKKAIEMKRKQKLQKKLSHSTSLQDDTFDDIMMAEKMNIDNNTDIESVDMDIGSDADEKVKESSEHCINSTQTESDKCAPLEKSIPVLMVTKDDELEEDEDLLRAKLLTSLSKNLTNLVNPDTIQPIETVKDTVSVKLKQPKMNVTQEKRFIINVESDSEGEHEATKNLTKMHIKLSEQVDFQQKLDMFLKSTRMEVEKTTTILPDVVQQPGLPKKNEKFVAKAVKSLPKSEQIEYKNLVKRMAELEKIKQARQTTFNINNKVLVSVAVNDTLKPRNITLDSSNLSTIDNLEEKIKNSRKHIAEESAKMLQLKDEGTKLSQKFKIVATELRNIKTAIALNKRQQRCVQHCLTKIRLHHQILLKSSLSSIHSKTNAILHTKNIIPKLQKENNPKDRNPLLHKDVLKENYTNPTMLKAIKIGIINDFKVQKTENKPKPPEKEHPRLSVEVDVTNNKNEETAANNKELKSQPNSNTKDLIGTVRHSSHPVVEKGGGTKDVESCVSRVKDDYRSPLDAFGSTTWKGDPNAILCPFEVSGDCKDTDCKYVHTNTHTQ